MKTMKTIARLCTLAAVALLLLPTGIAAQNAAVRKIMQTAREDNRAMHHLDILCNRFGGRITGSDAQENALKWASQCFEQWGYEVKMEQVGILATGFNRGGWWGRMTGDEQMTLNFVTPSYTAGTKGLQRGHVVIEPTTQAEFDRIKGRLRGAWVLINGRWNGYAVSNSPAAREQRRMFIARNLENERYNREQAGEDGEKRPIVKDATLFYDEMIEAGALGIIQAATVPLTSLYNTYVVNEKVPFDSLPTLPDIRLDEEQYNRIRTLVEQRRNVELEFDIRNHFRLGPIPYHNLVATLKGSKHPDEYVVVGGTYRLLRLGYGRRRLRLGCLGRNGGGAHDRHVGRQTRPHHNLHPLHGRGVRPVGDRRRGSRPIPTWCPAYRTCSTETAARCHT